MSESESGEYRVESVIKEDGETMRLWDDENIIHTETTEVGLEIWYLVPEDDDNE